MDCSLTAIPNTVVIEIILGTFASVCSLWKLLPCVWAGNADTKRWTSHFAHHITTAPNMIIIMMVIMMMITITIWLTIGMKSRTVQRSCYYRDNHQKHSVLSFEQMLAYCGLLSGMLFWGSLESVDVLCCSSAQVQGPTLTERCRHTLQIAKVWPF